MPDQGGQPVRKGWGVPHDDMYMTPWGRPDFITVGLKTVQAKEVQEKVPNVTYIWFPSLLENFIFYFTKICENKGKLKIISDENFILSARREPFQKQLVFVLVSSAKNTVETAYLPFSTNCTRLKFTKPLSVMYPCKKHKQQIDSNFLSFHFDSLEIGEEKCLFLHTPVLYTHFLYRFINLSMAPSLEQRSDE